MSLLAKAIALGATLILQSAIAADRPEFKSDKDKTSYAIGLDVARNFRKNGIEFDPAWVLLGLKDGLSSDRPLLKEKELRKVLGDFQNTVRQRMSANQRLLAADNRQRAQAFLESNRAQPGVQLLPGGIQYKVLKAGEGARADDLDAVLVNYRGTLLDGTEFDATDEGRPGTLKLVQTFHGLKQTLKAMPEGARWQVWIPPQLGYGERGVGTEVGPNELLTYELEVVRVVPSTTR